MTILLHIAALCVFIIGLIHSIMGERYILIHLFQLNNLPELFGSKEFTARTLRFAWHLTTIAWWGFAVIFVLLAKHNISFHNLSLTLAIVFLLTGLLTLVISHGRHWVWVGFLFISVIAFYAAFI